eukprot:3303638-Pyramimonas_sp.AAC.1
MRWIGSWPRAVLESTRTKFHDSVKDKYLVLLKDTEMTMNKIGKAYKLHVPSMAQASQFQAAFNNDGH